MHIFLFFTKWVLRCTLSFYENFRDKKSMGQRRSRIRCCTGLLCCGILVKKTFFCCQFMCVLLFLRFHLQRTPWHFNIPASGAIYGPLSIAQLLIGYLLELLSLQLAGLDIYKSMNSVVIQLAFLCSHLANKYMRQYHSHSVEQEVEWLYSFDVHANAFFCSFLLTYVLQV